MKRTLINPAVFAYTLYVKFEDKKTLIPLVFLMLVPIVVMRLALVSYHGPLTDEVQKEVGKAIGGYFFGSVVCVLVSYVFISDGPAGKKVISESDSLSLLFTRPLSRFCYVFSKYLAGFIGTSVTLCTGLLLNYLIGLCVGLNQIDISPIAFANVIANAASWAALVVFLHSAPPLAGLLTCLFLSGASGVGSAFSSTHFSQDFFLEMLRTICIFIDQWFGDMWPVSVDLAAMISAPSLDIYEVAIYLSNISLFLACATVALSRREFSYGSD